MTTPPSDPRSIVIAQRIYRMLLATYPRRFQEDYRSEMALLFLDCGREAYRARGRRGLLDVSGRALLDLLKNAPTEHVVQLTAGVKPAAPTRSCSSCYFEVQSDWQTCKFCGTYLNDATTHETHSIPTDRGQGAIEGYRGVCLPWFFKERR